MVFKYQKKQVVTIFILQNFGGGQCGSYWFKFLALKLKSAEKDNKPYFFSLISSNYYGSRNIKKGKKFFIDFQILDSKIQQTSITNF
jgi:cytoplasmic iron level regulating protein YaaA (DUF328/UPF0246 family)